MIEASLVAREADKTKFLAKRKTITIKLSENQIALQNNQQQ